MAQSEKGAEFMSPKRPKKTVVDRAYLKRFCNLKPDSLDPRDRPYMAVGVAAAAPRIPKEVDYSKETRPVGDQGYTGSCVGWSTAHGLRRWLHYKSDESRKNSAFASFG